MTNARIIAMLLVALFAVSISFAEAVIHAEGRVTAVITEDVRAEVVGGEADWTDSFIEVETDTVSAVDGSTFSTILRFRCSPELCEDIRPGDRVAVVAVFPLMPIRFNDGVSDPPTVKELTLIE